MIAEESLKDLETAITVQALSTLFTLNPNSLTTIPLIPLLRRLLVDDMRQELLLSLLPLGPSIINASFRNQPQPNSNQSTSSRSLNKSTSETPPTLPKQRSTSAPDPKNQIGTADENKIPKTSISKRKKSISPSSNISTAILRLFNHGLRGEQLLIGLVQTIQTVEVENLRSDRVTQLFRGNTLGCKIVSTFTTSIGRHYLQSVITPLIQKIQLAVANGVDFSSIKDASMKLRCNQVLKETFEILFSTSSNVPYTMGAICNHLRLIVKQRFPKHANVALSSFLFLRFFCPAIVNPSEDLLPLRENENKTGKDEEGRQRSLLSMSRTYRASESDIIFVEGKSSARKRKGDDGTVGSRITLTKEMRRGLIFVAKALQCLANSTNSMEYVESTSSSNGSKSSEENNQVNNEVNDEESSVQGEGVSNERSKTVPKAWPMTLEELDIYRNRMLIYFNEVCNRIKSTTTTTTASSTTPLSSSSSKSKTETTGTVSPKTNTLDNAYSFESNTLTSFDVESLCHLIRTNIPTLSETIVKQRNGNNHNNNHTQTTKSLSKKLKTSSSSSTSSITTSTTGAASSLFLRIPSFRSSRNSSPISSPKHSLSTSSSPLTTGVNGGVGGDLLCMTTPSELISNMPPLSLNDAMSLQGTTKYRTNIIMCEYYYKIVQQHNNRLHQYIRNFKHSNNNNNNSTNSSELGNNNYSEKYDESGEDDVDRWQLVRTETTTSNHYISTYKHFAHPTLYMERARFPVTNQQFYSRLSSFQNRTSWDATCISCNEIEKINPSCSILHTIIRTPSNVFTLSDRDYIHLQSHGPDLYYSTVQKQPTNTKIGEEDIERKSKRVHTMVSTSIVRSDCLNIKNYVRGDMEFNGFFIEEDENDKLSCIVTHIKSKNPKGWIANAPNVLIRSMFSDKQTSILASVADSLFTSVEDVSL